MLRPDERDELYRESLWVAFHDAALLGIEWRGSHLAMRFESGWPRKDGEQRTAFEWTFINPNRFEIEGEIPDLGRAEDAYASHTLPPDAREAIRLLNEAIERTDFWISSVGAKDDSMADFALIGSFNNAAGQPVEILVHGSATQVLIKGQEATLNELLELGNAAWDSFGEES